MTNRHEKLKIIKGYENYLISESGIVIRMPYLDSDNKVRQGMIIAQKLNNSGYASCALIRNKRIYTILVHRLVASAFIGESVLQVNHKDGNKVNNHYSNLEYLTDKENKRHAIENSLFQRGSRNGRSKLTESEVLTIKLLLNENKRTQIDIAQMFNISIDTVRDIKSRKTWKHIELTPSALKTIGI